MDTAFFWLSKIFWTILQPGTLLLMLVLLAWFLLMRGATGKARWVLSLAAAALLLVASIPFGNWLLAPLETRFATNPPLPAKVDGIIVLGGAENAVRSAEWDQVEVNESADRFLASLALARRFPAARLVFTSGSGNLTNRRARGADVARRLYRELGLDPARLVFERNSRNTAENASRSKALVKPARGEVWILVTSASHMPRAVGVFCKAGWPVVPWPVDHRSAPDFQTWIDYGLAGNLDTLSLGLKEWLGLVAYYATGKTGALFPSGCAR